MLPETPTFCNREFSLTYNSIVDLLFDSQVFNPTSKSSINYNVSKASESKPVKHEVNCSVMFPL